MTIENLIKNGIEFMMNSEFQRIINGNLLTLNKIPYSIEIYNNLIKHFEEKEEYEKCAIIKELKLKRVNHESNYTLN